MSADDMLADLQGSGLVPEDIGARLLGNPERAATSIVVGVQGYVIPYRDINGSPLPFYRVKCFNVEPKYKQVKASPAHVYFPKGFKELALTKGYIIITEGEKKAACAVKNGFPTIGLGGVDNWKNRTFVLPEEVELKHVHGKSNISAKLPPGEDVQEMETNLAVGMQELIDFAVSNNLTCIIIYDSDKNGVKFDVQRAAANLGFELRFKGLQLRRIRQLVLPRPEVLEKVGIDDLLVLRGRVYLEGLVGDCLKAKNTFPRHPNIREYVNKKLQKTKMSRKEAQQLSLAILCELDCMGSRLRSSEGDQLYYFSTETKTLMLASLKRTTADVLVGSEFGKFLYQQFGINHTDHRVVSWLATQFTSEEPIDLVSPSKVLTCRGDDIYYQINDGQYIAIGADRSRPWDIRDNGVGGVLFESGKVVPVDAGELGAELLRQIQEPIRPWWREVFKSVRLKKSDHSGDLCSLLYYMSPWLMRWRGTQLPVEMIIGEAGSGKSSLYELRLNILSGEPKLRNAPQDIRDWHASIVQSGALHVTDNVQLADKNLRQRLSDEMCRIVTEPNPHVEMRKLYTEADLVRIPVQSVFAITAIQQPFRNADLIQRAIIIELDKGDEEVEYDSSWSRDQLTAYGGRTAWLAHHIIVLHKFLANIKRDWDPKYKAKHRLINLEQIFVLMAKALGMESDWIPEYLTKATSQAVSENDWAIQGLVAFAEMIKLAGPGRKFSALEIAEWAQQTEEYAQCHQLVNARSLGRYLSSNKQTLALVAGIREAQSVNNRSMYCVRSPGK